MPQEPDSVTLAFDVADLLSLMVALDRSEDARPGDDRIPVLREKVRQALVEQWPASTLIQLFTPGWGTA